MFLDSRDEDFKIAFTFVKSDKIKTFSNGSQKTFARILYNKLVQKFPNTNFNKLNITIKTIDSTLVSATRKYLSADIEEIQKQKYQKTHSHCVDAMVVFYLANSKINGQERSDDKVVENHNKATYNFIDDIYLSENDTNIQTIVKRKTYITSDNKNLGSYKLFNETIYSENYYHITKKGDDFYYKETHKITKKDCTGLQFLIDNQLLYKNIKNKASYFTTILDINDNDICRINIANTSDFIQNIFNDKEVSIDNKKEILSNLQWIDNLRYTTSRKPVENIFFDDKNTKLLLFKDIKGIPFYSEKLYKAVYKILFKTNNLFNTTHDNKTILNKSILQDILKNLFSSKKQDNENRKRNKKRHVYSLPTIGLGKFRIKRDNCWQVLGSKDIATKNYIINGNITPVVFFSKNVIPLKIKDLIVCLNINSSDQSVYDVSIDVSTVSKFIKKLDYRITEKYRCSVYIELYKDEFLKHGIDFDSIKIFEAKNDEEFKKFIEFINDKNNELDIYLTKIRDNLKGKANLLEMKSKTIKLHYKMSFNSNNKDIIMKNII